jgi:hypothetical protein
VVPCKYDSLGTTGDNGYMVVFSNGKAGYVNKKGVEVIAPKYEYERGNNVLSFYQGHAIVKLNGKKGMINEVGKEIIPCKYDEMDAFRNGLACVAINNKWGFINEAGTEVIPLQYAKASPFTYEQTTVWETNGEEWTIDKTGNKIKMLYKPAPIIDSTTFYGIADGLKGASLSLGSSASAELSVKVVANGKTYSYTRGFVDMQQCHLKKDDKVTITVYMSKKGQLYLSSTGLKIEDFTYNDKGNSKTKTETKGRGKGGAIKLFGH